MLRRTLALSFVAAGLLAALPAVAHALNVHVRVEGKTRTIFGADEPLLVPFVGALTASDGSQVGLSAPTALGALETASVRGEFFYHLLAGSFGPYVDQIGRLAGQGASGWVFKVNGVSPPVGADAYDVKEGDRVLWYYATFGEAGGPMTLDLMRARDACFRAYEVDDVGARTLAANVVFVVDGRKVSDRDGLFCPARGRHQIRVTKDGDVRSQVLVSR